MRSDRVRIVLVEPSHPGNIGGAARAMKTMGFTDLALVRPVRFPDPQAEWRAAGAVDVLAHARVFDHLDTAIADCALVAGASVRTRHVPWPLDSAEGFAARLSAAELAGKPAAILFGRETSGLANDELMRCNLQVMIPAHPGYPSLNLAMAVQVVCYELYKAFADQSATTTAGDGWDRPLATAEQLAGLYTHLEDVLREIEFQERNDRRLTMTRLRRLFGRVHADETEVAILRGVLTHIQRALAGKSRRESWLP